MMIKRGEGKILKILAPEEEKNENLEEKVKEALKEIENNLSKDGNNSESNVKS